MYLAITNIQFLHVFLHIDPNDPDIVQTWLSNNETRRDLTTHLF